MTYQYRFCPTCRVRRVAAASRCSVCGGPVRSEHHSPAAARPVSQPLFVDWRALAGEEEHLPVAA